MIHGYYFLPSNLNEILNVVIFIGYSKFNPNSSFRTDIYIYVFILHITVQRNQSELSLVEANEILVHFFRTITFKAYIHSVSKYLS